MNRNVLLGLLFTLLIAPTLKAFEISGNVRSWAKTDFLGFDPVGDCSGAVGDISSAFARFEDNNLYLRLTFDDMVIREHNEMVKDNYLNKDLKIMVSVSSISGEIVLFSQKLSLNQLTAKQSGISILRTPETNMFECAILNPGIQTKEELKFDFKVYHGNQLVDSFSADGKGSKDTGNCAFVHHGNQGLTYTEVFYGSPWGISGLDGSGFDEVLQVHEATNVPGNFHMSGTLMPAAEWHNPEFNQWLETLASQGIASMMTSALGQHIMPFVQNDMNDWSVYVESAMVQHHYNYTPRVAWVPERVWLAPGYYPDAGVIDWLGDNWAQHGVWGVVLDDGPHLNGYDNRKIHWMNNGSGVSLRVIPINNSFVGNMHYDAGAAKNQIAGMGQYNICVYGTDWEVAAEMNEHDGTYFLDNYEDVIWYCHNNYPGVNVWKLEDAISNPDFNGTGANLTKGTYGLLGGDQGYGGSNNSWYINWASTASHSDFHDPKWDYGTVWNDAWTFLTSVTDNSLAQLGWYTLMINLHETGWHSGGAIADWEHRYSAHMKNANVHTEASRWADGQYTTTTACYFSDVDHDGIDELLMHNDKVFMIFEGIGGKANWVFYKNGFGDAYSVVSSDMAYWSETDGDYNESSNNHMAALSDVYPNQQNSIYNITVDKSSGDTVQATLTQFGVSKTYVLETGDDFLQVLYDFYDQTGYVKSGWSPDLLDLVWSGKGHLERVWGDYGSYCGYRNSSSGATVALVLGNGGASHNGEFEGTLVKGDEIKGYKEFKMLLYAGYSGTPTGTTVTELNTLASQNMDVFNPELFSPAILVGDNIVQLNFSESVDEISAENISNYTLQNFTGSYVLISAERQTDWTKVNLTFSSAFQPGDAGQILVSNVEDLYSNIISPNSSAELTVPNGLTPHTIQIDGTNDFTSASELIATQTYSLYISWDDNNLYIGLNSLDLNGGGDLFVNIDTDQTAGSGATTGSWGRVDYSDPYLPEYQVAIEGGGGSMQVNNYSAKGWNYPGNGTIGSSYEGWSGNGFTEISIPWYELGDPLGIALSVHVSAEDSEVVNEAFPVQNPIGSHPSFTHVYAFFGPYINGYLPLSGMVPNQVIVVPNTSPAINAYQPLSLLLDIPVNTTQNFIVYASDSEGDDLYYSWLLDGTEVGIASSYSFLATPALIGNHTLKALVTDNVPGNNPDSVAWDVTVSDQLVLLDLIVNLEGPFGGVEMSTLLNDDDEIPLVQPYSVSPWNYAGSESVSYIPDPDIVDWILVELRETTGGANNATGAAMVARQACFVKNDGSVLKADGTGTLQFSLTITDDLYAVVWHRNHLGIMSAFPVAQIGGVYYHDFSSNSAQVHGGVIGHKELAPGIWGMIGGDGDADGQVTNVDKNDVWLPQAGTSGYLDGDFSMDTQVNNNDKNDVWAPNTGSGTQVVDIIGTKKCQVPK